MSEELKQRTNEYTIGRFRLLNIGATTFGQLSENGIINLNKNILSKISNRKPDGLILDGKKIIAAIESKDVGVDLKTAKNQGASYTKIADIPLLITTDNISESSIYNGKTGMKIKCDNFISFDELLVGDYWESLFDDLVATSLKNLDEIEKRTYLDLSTLSHQLWQKIYVATSKSSIKCLYNVVELILFKYLSDKDILPSTCNFDEITKISEKYPDLALTRYATETRAMILNDFPKGADKTSIINGTIFINEDETANLTQSILFADVLKILNDYSVEHGDFKHISKDFKTKLFESFVNGDSKSAFGQFFTPRKIVQTIIKLTGVDSDRRKKLVIGDPFCGVGGFLLETLNLRDENILSKDSSIYKGYDKGIDKDDERTIILAKANSLLYNSEILNDTNKSEISKWINNTFELKRDNLGTFSIDPEPIYDYILSNPPYITKGTSIVKDSIINRGLKGNFPILGSGLEALSMEWIIQSLKPGGIAAVVLPKGVLENVRNKKLRKWIINETNIKSIISLPMRAFFDADVETNIIILEKKFKKVKQKDKILIYDVKNIGEQLTHKGRESIADNDLPHLETAFFRFAKDGEYNDDRAKTIDIDDILESDNIDLDNRKYYEDYLKKDTKDTDEIIDTIDDFMTKVSKNVEKLHNLEHELKSIHDNYITVTLDNEDYFKTQLGKRITKKQSKENSGDIIIYSSNTYKDDSFGTISREWMVNKRAKHESNMIYNEPMIMMNVLGSVGHVHMRGDDGKPYTFIDSTKAIKVTHPDVIQEYVLYEMKYIFYNLNLGFTANLSNEAKINSIINIKIPVVDGKPSKELQQMRLNILKRHFQSLVSLKKQSKVLNDFIKEI